MSTAEAGMLAAIVRFSLRFRGIIVALSLVFVCYGLYRLSRAKYDVFPEFAPPQVIIQNEASGLSSEQVEILVTQPIENAVNGVPGVKSLRSASIQGLSVIALTFNSGSDIYRDRQMVAEQLATVSVQLPKGIASPVMTPLTSSTSVVLVAGLTSDARSLMELRAIADWTVKPRLLAVPGVAKVVVFSRDVRQLQIQVNPDLLIKFNLGLTDVLAASRRATGVRGAGLIEGKNQRITIQTEGQSLTPDRLAQTLLVYQNGASVRIGDVAKVTEAPEPPIGAASVMGHPAVQLLISAQYGSNTLEVVQGIGQAWKELRPVLKAEKVTLHPDLFRPAGFIETALHNIMSSLLLGAGLVVVVLFLFLFNFRTAAISCTAIPLSLLAGVTILDSLGFSLNTMTLGGLAIAIGEVVDDAVIDVENVLRRLRENRHQPHPRPAFQVVFDASIEIRSAVVYATFAIILVFVPILTMTGVAGRLFSPLGIAYISAVLASLLVALTLTPALCLILLGKGKIPGEDPPVTRRLKEKYRSVLIGVEENYRTVITVVTILTAGGFTSLYFMGGAFLPELQEGHFIVHMSAAPGTSVAESLRLGKKVTEKLLKIPSVRSVDQRVGRAEKGDDWLGPHQSEFDVNLKALTADQAESAQGDIRNALSQFVGVDFSMNTFLSERVEETISGYTAAFVVSIFGNDLRALDTAAQAVTATLKKIPGATDVMIQSRQGTPQLIVRLRKPDLLRWGFDPVDVLDAIRTAYNGDVVGQVYERNRIYNVSVIWDPAERRTPSQLGMLPLRNVAGTYVHLRQLADIHEVSGRYAILHQGARRVQVVTCNAVGPDLGAFAAEAKRMISSEVSLPPGTYMEFLGTAEARAKSQRDLIFHSLLAGAGIIMLLAMVIRNFPNFLLLFLNLPFALVGGMLAVFASGGVLSIGSAVGFITLFGITLRNSIMLISHWGHLVSVEGMEWGAEASARGALERLAPILMTAAVTAFGLLPMAIGSGAAGREIEGPMAIVILGGLVTSTSLNLLVLPSLALRYGRFEKSSAPVSTDCNVDFPNVG